MYFPERKVTLASEVIKVGYGQIFPSHVLLYSGMQAYLTLSLSAYKNKIDSNWLYSLWFGSRLLLPAPATVPIYLLITKDLLEAQNVKWGNKRCWSHFFGPTSRSRLNKAAPVFKDRVISEQAWTETVDAKETKDRLGNVSNISGAAAAWKCGAEKVSLCTRKKSNQHDFASRLNLSHHAYLDIT